MKTLYQALFLAISALALAGMAYAQVPSTNDISDSNLNTGMGTGALGLTGTNAGTFNTAAGGAALFSNTSGTYNTAFGVYALFNNTTASNNTAVGHGALLGNQIGTRNVAMGALALYNNTASDNNAVGYEALYSDTTGYWNNAVGSQAMKANTTGTNNNAVGFAALLNNTTGSDNNAQGFEALLSNTTGSNNTAIGYQAGSHQTTGGNNIYIGNQGIAAENGQIRIGTSAQTGTYVAGIYGRSVSGSAVMVSSTGQLGVSVSSERFKTAIAPMGSDTTKLAQLRPVSFKLKSDASGTRQYGLIAEEVAKVYPELVIRDQNGRIDSVRYDELAPMLLNDAQQQAAKIRDLERQVAEMHAALLKLQAKDERVAQR
jgi:hypothetical protein